MQAIQFAQLSAAIYAGAGFDRVWTLDDVVVGLKRVNETDVLALRGSLTAEDWVRDLEAIPEWHPGLGFVHSGFIAGMDDVFAAVRGVVGPKVAITGHSLGGARARLLAGLFAINQMPVDQLCVFGSPKPAFTNLARVIAKARMQHTSYRNRNDVVPTLPLTIEPLLDFVHTEAWTPVSAAPASDDLQALRDHSMALYVQALTPVRDVAVAA